MILTDKAIEAIKGSPELKRELMYQMEISYSTLMLWVNGNEKDGKQTTVRFVEIVALATGLTQEEILTEKIIA